MLERKPCAINGFSLPSGKLPSSTGITQHCMAWTLPSVSATSPPQSPHCNHTYLSVPASGPLHMLFFLPTQAFTHRHTPLLHHLTFYLFFKSQLKWYSLDHLPGTHQICNYVFSCLMSLHLSESKISRDTHHVPSTPPHPHYFFTAIYSACHLIVTTDINKKVIIVSNIY